MSVAGARTTDMDWVRALVVDQLGFYWDAHLWPRLQGLTDEEYFWEPVPGAWSIRPDADGVFVQDGARMPPPVPPPVTTIAWRIVHARSAGPAWGVFRRGADGRPRPPSEPRDHAPWRRDRRTP
jgi:hypothetical protein